MATPNFEGLVSSDAIDASQRGNLVLMGIQEVRDSPTVATAF